MAESKYPDLTTFKALSFDCYGTVIDMASGIRALIKPLLAQLPPSHPLLAPDGAGATAQESLVRHLEVTYSHNDRAETLDVLTQALGTSVPPDAVAAAVAAHEPGTWSAFADTVAGLRKLQGRYARLLILSNIDNANMEATLAGLGPGPEPERFFDAAYTAQNIGSVKPDRRNFEYLFAHAREQFGVDAAAGELLHVAVSLRADHVPAKELGLRSVWIARGKGEELERYEGRVAFEWRFETLGEFADEVERQFGEKEKEKEQAGS